MSARTMHTTIAYQPIKDVVIRERPCLPEGQGYKQQIVYVAIRVIVLLGRFYPLATGLLGWTYVTSHLVPPQADQEPSWKGKPE